MPLEINDICIQPVGYCPRTAYRVSIGVSAASGEWKIIVFTKCCITSGMGNRPFVYGVIHMNSYTVLVRSSKFGAYPEPQDDINAARI